ncbi:MAG: NAD-binding protein [Gammaproteobacteria bacterium]|nr:NAD-binding protein [Gammaproteobacteria bacterium]
MIAGFGRVGHAISFLLRSAQVPFVAFDTDPARVTTGRKDGYPVHFGDISDPGFLSAIHVERASMVVITVDKVFTAFRAISNLRTICPQVPVIARARDTDASTRFWAPAQPMPTRRPSRPACASVRPRCRCSTFRRTTLNGSCRT